jgi:hypothetical protein
MLITTQTDKKYGLLLSGGIDSAILLYLLIKSNANINLQPFTIPKTDGAYLYADPIINHFNQKFKLSISKTIQVGDPTVHHRLQSTTAIQDIFEKNPVDYLFVGINQNPLELNALPGAPQRDKKSTDPRIIFPFVDLYKHNILEFMYADNQEDLIDITHSCTEQQVGRCNRCWQCTERMWAFKQLDKTDTGQL